MDKTRGPCEEVLIEGEWVIGMTEVDKPDEPDEEPPLPTDPRPNQDE